MSKKDAIVLGTICMALVALEQLPDHFQPKGDMEDMRAILSEYDQTQVAALLAYAKCRLNPDLSPTSIYEAYGFPGVGA